MKAADLYAILAKMTPAEREATRVVLSHDAEGNGFSPLHNADIDHGGNFECDRITKSMRAEVASGPVLVLWPM